jgi:phosphatidylserine/phosphatidylglycerophosphate/cardiolipin synthase-like enzyme
LRTYACDAGYPFAPQGEFTGRDAYLKAISLASDYVYIEDQYFVSYEIADALSTALRTHPSLHVIIVLNGTCPYPGADRIFYYHQNEIFEQIRNAGDDRFAAYYLRSTRGDPRPEIYVHAKVMIVDDVWAYIGAMNCNRRSMTYDAEIGIAVVDATIVDGVCQFARDLRVQLWSEHLDFMVEGGLFLTDPVAGFREWDERADRPDVHATVHSPHTTSITQAQYENGWEQIWDLLDPQGICPDEPR